MSSEHATVVILFRIIMALRLASRGFINRRSDFSAGAASTDFESVFKELAHATYAAIVVTRPHPPASWASLALGTIIRLPLH